MRRRLDKTLADYVAIAISPVLIMTLVGSLIYFLLEVSYRGAYPGRVHFIFACFVVAGVLIGRIAIEQGKERAQMYAAGLAVAIFLAILRFAEASLVNVLLIGLIWWCTNKLTWDCTLIDESEDASGEGLLQTAGLDERAAGGAQAPAEEAIEAEKAKEPEGVTSRDEKTPSWWERLVRADRRPHAPGLWVVYFSLAALPIFGLGQLFIPKDDAERRRYVFLLLLVYVASGLGLLLTTSFLGLRRYLRQRHVQMPVAMAGVWLTVGCVLIVALLAVAAILPRPSAEYDVAELPFEIGSADRGSSQYAAGTDGAEIDKGGPRRGTRDDQQKSAGGEDDQRDSEAPSKGKAQGEGEGLRRQSDEDAEDNQDEDNGSGGRSKGEKEGSGSTTEGDEKGSGDKKGSGDEEGSSAESKQDGKGSRKGSQDQGRTSRSRAKEEQRDSESGSSRWGRRRQADRDTDQTQQAESEDSEQGAGRNGRQRTPFRPEGVLGNLGGWIATLLKWVVYAVLLCLIGYWLWRRRAEWLKALGNLLEGWRRFWQRLFGRKPSAAGEAPAAEESPKPAPRSFADFVDPFATGADLRYSADQLVRYSFEAVEAWAREHGCARGPEQTPHEFTQELGSRATSLSQDVRRLADLYCRVAYAPGSLPKASVAPLEQLWRKLRQQEWVPV